MKRFAAFAAIVALTALAACADRTNPLGGEPGSAYSSEVMEAGGPGGTIGSGHEPMTTSTDSAGRGPGTYGSGH